MPFAKRLITICAAVALVLAPCRGADAQHSHDPPGVVLVRRLYADFACDAVLDVCDSAHELVDQPRSVLERYFDPALARLWIADRQCVYRTHEICRIDFAPMWNSQDPIGMVVHVSPGTDSTQVRVELWHAFDKQTEVLLYTLARTPHGWRIHDIAFGTEWSLVALLSGKP